MQVPDQQVCLLLWRESLTFFGTDSVGMQYRPTEVQHRITILFYIFCLVIF